MPRSAPYIDTKVARKRLENILRYIEYMEPFTLYAEASRLVKDSTGLDHALELKDQLIRVREEGGTGEPPCKHFCEARAHADKIQALQTENAELKEMIVKLKP